MSKRKHHLLTDKFFILPISGKYAYTLCGMPIGEKLVGVVASKDAPLVTCKRCLDKMLAKARGKG